ncbi:MAG TPA: hypothetical protein VHS33_08150 [Sphingomicrobium sp.]|nr:hypothetical protein [Sphingomicrobium sp.]
MQLRGQLPKTVFSFVEDPGFLSFAAPEVFDIFSNYEETLAFLLDIRSLFRLIPPRRRGGRPMMANFSHIKRLDPASGLLLAAEIDRWRRAASRKPVPHDHLWDENVRNFFHDAGLFELLGIDPRTTRSQPTGAVTTKTLPFQTGTLHEGGTADRFRATLESLIGRSVGPRNRVYDAISEAMTNVAHHAYPSEIMLWPESPKNRWWLGGSWLPDERIATVQIYDHGVGIPRTLPKSRHWSEVLPIFGRIDRERTDAGMIEAAMDYGRTSTGQVGRGKGLAQMAEWITAAGNGALRILSGRGALTYLPGKRPIRVKLPVEFRGTLIEWKVQL